MEFLVNILIFFQEYAYFIAGFGILLLYIYNSYIKQKIEQYLQQKADAEYHKNPDLFQAKALAMEEARLKMQEKYMKQADEYQQKLELREEEKRKEKLDRVAHVSTGEKLGKDTKKSFREEYHPLMGAGGSGGYRAPKKGCCGKKCG